MGDWRDACGRRHRQFLSANKEEATRILTKLVRQRDLERAGVLAEGGLDLPIERLLEVYEQDLKARATPKSLEMRKAAVSRVQDFTAARVVRDLTPYALSKFRASRLRQGRSKATVNEDVLAVRAMLNCGLRMGLLQVNPLAEFKLLPVGHRDKVRRPRALTDAECKKLLEACATMDAKHPEWVPQEPLVLALLSTGARWGELTALTWDAVDLENLTLTLYATKNRQTRQIPLDSVLASRLGALYVSRPMEATVFRAAKGGTWRSGSNFRRYLRRAFKRAGIALQSAGGCVHVHALRHTFVTRLARAGVPIQQAQYLSGHKTARVLLEVYTHLDVEAARESLGRLPALSGEGE